MEIVLEIIIAILSAFGAVSIVWCICAGRPVEPPAFGETEEIIAVIRSGGDCEKLQGSLNALRWLKQHGAPELKIIVEDDALDQASRRLAENYSALDDEIMLCSTEEIFRF